MGDWIRKLIDDLNANLCWREFTRTCDSPSVPTLSSSFPFPRHICAFTAICCYLGGSACAKIQKSWSDCISFVHIRKKLPVVKTWITLPKRQCCKWVDVWNMCVNEKNYKETTCMNSERGLLSKRDSLRGSLHSDLKHEVQSAQVSGPPGEPAGDHAGPSQTRFDEHFGTETWPCTCNTVLNSPIISSN